MVWGLWARARQNIHIYLPICLSVCLWVCLFVYQKCILPLASDLYKLRHCLGLKHNFLETSPSQINPNWSTQRKYVVVTLDHPGNSGGERVQCSKGFELEQKHWLHVYLSATSLLSSLLKTWLISLVNTLYLFSIDRAHMWKLILVNKGGFI